MLANMTVCPACGSETVESDNGLTVCPHCDQAHQCRIDDPTCRRFSVWYGDGPAK